MESIVGSGLLLRLWLLRFKLCTLMVHSAVFQVFCSYETIQACWDWRRTGRRISTLGWSPQRHLLFRECFVVGGMKTVVSIVVVVVSIGASIVAILLRDSFHRAIELVHGL